MSDTTILEEKTQSVEATQSKVPSVTVGSGAIKRSATWAVQQVEALPVRLDNCARFLVRAWCDPDNRLPGFIVNKRSWVLGAKLALVGVMLYGFIDCIYIVDVGQEGVHLRLGKFSHVTQPGLNFRLPYGIDRITFVNTQFLLQDEFGYRTRIQQGPIELVSTEPAPAPDQGDQEVVDAEVERTELLVETQVPQLPGHPDFLKSESHMITGNLNIVDVSWAIQYEIVDSYKYLFHSAETARNVRDIGAIAMSRAVGNRLDMEILTHSRGALKEDAKRYAQGLLDTLDIGLQVKDVIIQDVSPPPGTQPSYHAVTSASQEVDNLINQAEREYNGATVRAYGEADEIRSQANAYKTLTINRAMGEANRFKQIVAEYKKAPEVTRTRIFLETMEEVVSKVQYTVVDPDVQGIMPFFTGNHRGSSNISPLLPVAAHEPVTNQPSPPMVLDPATHNVSVPSQQVGTPMELAPVASQMHTGQQPPGVAPMSSPQTAAAGAVNAGPHTPAQAQHQAAKSGWSFFGWW